MKSVFVAAAIAAAVLPVHAQWYRSGQPPRYITSQSVSTDSLLPLPQKPDSLARIIVEFREEPLFVSSARSARLKTTGSFYQQRFDQFSSDLAGSAMRSSAAGVRAISFSHTYFKTFFGVSLTVPSSQLAEILNLPYVKTVHPDRVVTASVDKSALQMSVPQVWQTFGSQGEGIRVGIIDTGIDYLHPALGGGFGPGFKVAGGYDFVNRDSDPRDDEGHGTHVAGIVAADTDSIKGIAPKVILYAYKVLDARGSGFESDVIAAIERTVDPDDDGDPSDRLDVVNLSLGTNVGYPTDPSAVAVNNASGSGVIFCIAAGNSGYGQSGWENNYYRNGSATVGSPGTAEMAITVGAVDSTDILANFSSKGPNRSTFGIKPDIVAPGVRIVSTVLSNSYDRYNGTSMATPMVTGVTALLRSIHPDWTPDRIKSAMVNTARSIGISAYQQGGGRVQALKAASSTAWVRPTLLNFGLDDPSVATWTRQDTLMVLNKQTGSQSFSAVVSGVQSGITIGVSPSAFSIAPGDSLAVIVTLSVNNAAIPVVDDNIPLFSGSVKFAGAPDTLTVPWAFARASRLRLVFNEPNPSFVIYGGPTFYVSRWSGPNWISPTTAEVYGLPRSSHDFFTVFPSVNGAPKIVIRQSQALSSDAMTLAINSTEATLPLVFRGVDHNGARISSYSSPKKALVTTLPGFGDWVTLLESKSDTVRISPVSANYAFRPMEFQFDGVSTKTFHIVQYPKFSGMQNGMTLANASSNFVHQQFAVKYPPTVSEAMLIASFFYYRDFGGTGFLMEMGVEADTVSVVNGEAVLNGYFGRSSDPQGDAAVVLYSVSDLSVPMTDFGTSTLMISQDSIVALPREQASITSPRSPSGGSMTFGGAPVHVFTFWFNNVFGEASLHFNPSFRGARREYRFTDVNHGTYTVYDAAGNVVVSQPLNDFPRPARQLTPNWHKAVITSSNYWLRGIKGRVTEATEFNLATTPANPPSLTSFLVLDGRGQPTHSLPPGGAGSFMFSGNVINFSNEVLPVSDSTKAWYRIHGTTDWIPLSVQNIANDALKDGSVFRSDLSPALTLDSAAVDLRVVMKESRGYSLDFEAVPAFAVGTWGGESPTTVEADDSILPSGFALHQNYPNPFNASSNFEFRIADFSPVTLRIYDVLGREVATLVNEVLPPGGYKVRWNADAFPTGLYLARLTSGQASATKKVLLIK